MQEDFQFDNIEEPVRVILVGVNLGGEDDFERSMKELKSLAKACGKVTVGFILICAVAVFAMRRRKRCRTSSISPALRSMVRKNY